MVDGGRPVRYWTGSYYPDAGELTAWEEGTGGTAGALGDGISVSDRMAAIFAGDKLDVDAPPGAGSARDQETREQDTRKRSGRRARSRLRRYACANRLDRLVVLTYREPQTDLARVKRDVRLFVKRKLRGLIGPDAAYAITWETHKSGAWHVNLLVPSYIRHERLERAWGRGFVWITKFKAPKGGSGRDAARAAARYVAKYAGKDVEGMPGAVHRYEVAQGFQPNVVRLYGLRLADVMRETGEQNPPRYVWQSIGEPDHRGPPVAFASWS